MENFEAQVLPRARMASRPCSPEPGTRSQDPGSRAGSLETLIATAGAGAQRSCGPPAADPGQGPHEPARSRSPASRGSLDAGSSLPGAGLDAEEGSSQPSSGKLAFLECKTTLMGSFLTSPSSWPSGTVLATAGWGMGAGMSTLLMQKPRQLLHTPCHPAGHFPAPELQT